MATLALVGATSEPASLQKQWSPPGREVDSVPKAVEGSDRRPSSKQWRVARSWRWPGDSPLDACQGGAREGCCSGAWLREISLESQIENAVSRKPYNLRIRCCLLLEFPCHKDSWWPHCAFCDVHCAAAWGPVTWSPFSRHAHRECTYVAESLVDLVLKALAASHGLPAENHQHHLFLPSSSSLPKGPWT